MRYIVKSFIMRLKFLIMGLALLCASTVAATGQWEADILDGYERTVIAMPDDYSGKVVATVVKKADMPAGADVALLYVHGYNDYFFQSELGDSVMAHGYNFYALDLRKYGRSLLPHQDAFYCKSLDEYFADVDTALAIIRQEGNERIVLMGHSTGGLIAAYYLKHHPDAPVAGLILNSPFLDWNFGWLMEGLVLPSVSFLGRFFPECTVQSGGNPSYAYSLLQGFQLSIQIVVSRLGHIHIAHIQAGREKTDVIEIGRMID